jgi:hypothetical protein
VTPRVNTSLPLKTPCSHAHLLLLPPSLPCPLLLLFLPALPLIPSARKPLLLRLPPLRRSPLRGGRRALISTAGRDIVWPSAPPPDYRTPLDPWRCPAARIWCRPAPPTRVLALVSLYFLRIHEPQRGHGGFLHPSRRLP